MTSDHCHTLADGMPILAVDTLRALFTSISAPRLDLGRHIHERDPLGAWRLHDVSGAIWTAYKTGALPLSNGDEHARISFSFAWWSHLGIHHLR